MSRVFHYNNFINYQRVGHLSVITLAALETGSADTCVGFVEKLEKVIVILQT